ncbi:VasL domain-containing protein [Avibacterium paragallinarum]|uniref:VasL domain-containing protein n=1 Tax=Avibacterium paragallinarum TaxID=728 RepID=UPI00397CC1E8
MDNKSNFWGADHCLDNALTLIVEEIKKHSDLPINLNNLLVLVSEQIDKRVTSQYGKNIELIESTIVTSSPKPSLAQPKQAKVKAKEKSKPSEETNTPIKILRKTYLISLLFLMLGIILGGSSTYFYTEKYQKELQMKDELTQMLSSPTYLFKRGKAYIKSTNEQTLKAEWQNKIEYYENIGKTLVEPSKLRQQLNTLQQELLQAEKSRKGLTISYLKTALYDMEKELDSHLSLEQTLHIYADNPQDWEQKQRINKHFLSLLAYYAYLDDVESTKEKDKR